MNIEDRPTPETDSDSRPYPLPEHAQRIRFEGCECVVMAPEDYEALYAHARNLERQRDALREALGAIVALGDKVDPEGLFHGLEHIRAKEALAATKPKP